MDAFAYLTSPLYRLLLSLVWIGAMFLAWRVLARVVLMRARSPRKTRRRWIIQWRNLVVLGGIFGMAVIWFEQLRDLGTALALVAGGLAIATKEFWLNIIGYFFHPMAHSFGIGERIKVGECRGDVIDQNMMGTTLLEVGPGPDNHQYTGRTVFVPNSLFLNEPLVNETFLREFVFHLVRVPLRADADWREAEKRLLEAARHVSAPYIDRARQHIMRIEKRHSLIAPTSQPHVRITLPDSETIVLLLRLPVPARRRSNVEQAILRRYLENGNLVTE